MPPGFKLHSAGISSVFAFATYPFLTSDVERLKKTWSKLGIWESQIFGDLKELTLHLSNFKSLRNMQDSLISDSPSSLLTLNQSNNPSAAHHTNSSSPNLHNASGGTLAHFAHNMDVGVETIQSMTASRSLDFACEI
ncbi:hypothetical protein PCASD_20436 [Puccinia coronata f. sp. avenae]|uniref:Ras-GEF domain-containing protein n=1 Tax=Puccinia coronata f. sp. avenae TaxID=200324 RepID=A0A2N5TQN4_9BASI|nr:hypothetical protein PCASD_20442 [Puccinia coronata f. sp. avenae]PLW27822.1 hypothetical protein PCASD_20436 [Puccinia coronata f. sp. avenae]